MCITGMQIYYIDDMSDLFVSELATNTFQTFKDCSINYAM